MTDHDRNAERFFHALTAARWPILVVGVVLAAAATSFLPRLVKDTTADGFIDPKSPALVYRQTVEEVFGLKDPIVVAVISDDSDGVFDAESLALVERLTAKVKRIEYVDPERVTSLATENNITGVDDGMIVEGFLQKGTEFFRAEPGSAERAQEIRSAVREFPLLQGSLVARDERATIIVAELLDEEHATAAYDAVLAIIADEVLPEGTVVHVAGEGAVSGYLSTYIDNDARRLNPIAGLIITAVLALAFVSVRGALVPNLIVAGTVAGTLGSMAAFGVSFFVITNGLIVNMIGIAVADSIHILSTYYEELRERPQDSQRAIVARAMAAMWRPVTLTSATTLAGFLALAASSVMPPVKYFGVFGALAVFFAWVYSVTFLPAVLSIWPSKRLAAPFRVAPAVAGANRSSRAMREFGRFILSRPRAVLGVSAVVLVVAAVGAGQVVIDEKRIDNFRSSEPLYKADTAINAAMDGTYYLDVLVQTDEPEGLYQPDALRRIEKLQTFLATLPHVNGSTSIVDYVKQLHRSVNEGRAEEYRIPDDPLLIAQLFFLYSATADPTDFDEEVDGGYERALVRANVDTSTYRTNRVMVPMVEKYLAETFNADGITGTVTGRINVDYHWIDGIARSNLLSVLLSFGAVLAVAALLFGSVVAGLIASSPVCAAVLIVYAVMGFAGIPLGVGTSMFSAIAIGLSIDFAIHALDRIRELVAERGLSDETLLELYPTTGRALLFNFVAVTAGFGVLVTSDVPPLVKFGSLVTVAMTVAFVASVTLLPVLVKVLRPAFLTASVKGETHDCYPEPVSIDA